MKTNAHRQETKNEVSREIRWCGEALTRMAHPVTDWRMDALTRAGDLAVAGRLAESREIASRARE